MSYRPESRGPEAAVRNLLHARRQEVADLAILFGYYATREGEPAFLTAFERVVATTERRHDLTLLAELALLFDPRHRPRLRNAIDHRKVFVS